MKASTSGGRSKPKSSAPASSESLLRIPAHKVRFGNSDPATLFAARSASSKTARSAWSRFPELKRPCNLGLQPVGPVKSFSPRLKQGLAGGGAVQIEYNTRVCGLCFLLVLVGVLSVGAAQTTKSAPPSRAP